MPVGDTELVHAREQLVDADALLAVTAEVARDVGVFLLAEELRPPTAA